MKRNAIIAAIAAATFSVGAYAADLGVGASGSADASVNTQSEGFNQLDTNHDGKLSRSEAQADPRLANQVGKLDTDGDGTLDQSEFSALEGNAPSAVAPAGRPKGMDQPGAGSTMPAPGATPGAGATPPGMSTNPGASEAAPGHM